MVDDLNEQSVQTEEQEPSYGRAETSSERVTVDASTSGSIPLPGIGDEEGNASRLKRFRWNNFTYTTRVTAAFAFIAAMTALVAIGVLSFVWEQHFQTYTQENMRSLAESTAERIETIYNRTGTLDDPQVVATAQYAQSLSKGAGIMVVDNKDNKTIYDSSNPKYDESADGKNEGEVPKNGVDVSLAPSSSSGNQIVTAKIISSEDIAVGSVRVWVYGSDALLRASDEEFRNNSYQAMIFATVLAIVLASLIGFLFARNLVSPINRMTKTAKAIKEGDLAARTRLHGDDEIARLGETFDEMADSVERDRKLERRLTTDVAHELRTPLMAIQSTVEAMVDGVFEADEERLETVNSEVQRLSRLVDAILKLSRLENRSTPMKEEIVDVGRLISSIVATHEAFVADSGLTLSYEMERGVCVRGDADMIRQATANLISNAVRYTPEGGHITVQVKRGDIMASIVVQDTGIGLSPDEAKMVFSRFWRADAGRTRESGGLGIGLSVVKEIVDRHGGWVQVEGRKGEGACFTIHLPLYDESRQRGKERGQQQKSYKAQQKAQKTRAKSHKDQK